MTEFEQQAHASLLRELELMKAQAVRRAKEDFAVHASPAQWAAVYGQPVPGQSRTVAQVAVEAQLAARGRAWASDAAGPEIFYGPEAKGWR